MAIGAGLVAGLGGAASLIGGLSANKASKEMMRRQAQGADLANQTYRQSQPVFGQLLQQYASRAGLGGEPGVQQLGPGHYALTAGGMPGGDRSQYGLGGAYGSMEDQLRLRAAEEDINKRRMMQENQLRHRLGGAGVAQGSIGAALARNQGAADQEFGQFRRGLAINAGQEQERRLASLQSLLGMGFGQGAQANAIYGQQGAQYGQQAAGNFAGLGNILSQYAYGQQLGGQQPGSGIDPNELIRLLSSGGGGGLGGGGTLDSHNTGGAIYDPMTGRRIG